MSLYRFGEFTLSPQRRLLIRDGRELPLIPRYFDLLVFLIERRQEAVPRQQIFDRVWGGVIVSDSALSQAIRTLRRTLGDDSREPRYIRTVSRHGYQFVFTGLVEEAEEMAASPTGERSTLAEARGPLLPLVVSRLQQAARSTPVRWARAAAGGGIAGGIAGAAGGLLLTMIPGGSAASSAIPVLTAIGGISGAVGGAGVGAGISVGDASTRSLRTVAVISGAAAGGMFVGALTELLAEATLSAIVGVDVQIGGTLEGLVIGTAAGVGYALGTTPRGGRSPVLLMALLCGVAALALTQLGRPLVGSTVHLISEQAQGSLTLTPLARLIGQPDFGRVPQALLGTAEGVIFGIGLALGLRSRDQSFRSFTRRTA